MQPKCKFSGHDDEIVCIRHDFLSNLFVTGSEDNTARIWDPNSKFSVRAITGFSDAVNSVAFSPIDSNLVFASCGEEIFGYDLRNTSIVLKQFTTSFQGNGDEINEIDIDPQGKYLSACDDAGEVKIFNIQSQEIAYQLANHKDICSSALFLPNKKNLQMISGSFDTTAVHSFIESGPKNKNIYPIPENEEKNAKQSFNPPFIHKISVSSNGSYFAVAYGSGHVRIFPVHGSKSPNLAPIFEVDQHSSSCSQVCFLDSQIDGELLTVSAGNDLKILLHSFNISKQQKQKNQQTSPIKTIASILHPSKPNWISTFKNEVFVVDGTKSITVYSCT